MSKVIVVTPHPDDETLGCGGTILNHVAKGDEVYWLIMTTMKGTSLFTDTQIAIRDKEIQKVASSYDFSGFFISEFSTASLDTVPRREIVSFISSAFDQVKPETIYIPYVNDVHSDHEAVYLASVSCTKSFRYPYVKRVRIYETLSETEFGLRPDNSGFHPNMWVDITQQLDRKIEIMGIYESELGQHPFPRSEENIRALATLRGATAGVKAAEAFISVKEIIT